MLRKKIKEEIKYENMYGLANGKRVVIWKTIGRILILPFRLIAKLYEWVYYDETEEKLDRIRRGY